MISRTQLLIAITLILSVIVVTLYLYQFSAGFSTNQSDWAGFGSYVGGTLGTLFAFSSFWILFCTFKSQQKQLKSNELQNFETTFYSLLTLHNQVLKGLELKFGKDELGNIFINKLKDPAKQSFSISVARDAADEEYAQKQLVSWLKSSQKNILEEEEISYYFRVLYQLLKFIATYNISNVKRAFDNEYLDDQSTINMQHEKMYASLVRGFVPVRFLPILAINSIPTDDGFHNLSKYIRLLERYEFLEHIQLENLPNFPCAFLILQRYSRALGQSRDVKDKIKSIEEEYPRFSQFASLNQGYLSK